MGHSQGAGNKRGEVGRDSPTPSPGEHNADSRELRSCSSGHTLINKTKKTSQATFYKLRNAFFNTSLQLLFESCPPYIYSAIS